MFARTSVDAHGGAENRLRAESVFQFPAIDADAFQYIVNISAHIVEGSFFCLAQPSGRTQFTGQPKGQMALLSVGSQRIFGCRDRLGIFEIDISELIHHQ